MPFPYRIEAPENAENVDKAQYIEEWLGSFEPLEERPAAPSDATHVLKKCTSSKRKLTRQLIGLSGTGLRDCLPHLDVGKAFANIGEPTLATSEIVTQTNGSTAVNGYEEDEAGQEFVDVLSGHSVLLSYGDDGRLPYAPWSLRYSGHQFGLWAGQLGDGRAISICESHHRCSSLWTPVYQCTFIVETPHPSVEGLQYELQLKGAGRTPYSRTADGLAVLRSSIREYLCAEGMSTSSLLDFF
jgi:hypothetical protein